MVVSQTSSANQTAPADPVVSKDTSEGTLAEKEVEETTVTSNKPKYTTHEEAKAAFKELLRDKVFKGLF